MKALLLESSNVTKCKVVSEVFYVELNKAIKAELLVQLNEKPNFMRKA